MKALYVLSWLGQGKAPRIQAAELVFIPAIGIGHLASSFEIAKLLVVRDDRLFITVLTMKLPLESKLKLKGADDAERIRFINLRFLWSLRQPPPKGELPFASDYADPSGVLPQGFLDRTAGTGKVIGWAPQVAVLGHPSVGGFVSHCGWNSTLESLWYGVPVAAWPMYAEQHLNAFELVRELGLAVEIKMDYRREGEVVVRAEEIERGIREVMEVESEQRKKVQEMSEKSRRALMDGGSSHSSLGRLIDQIFL